MLFYEMFIIAEFVMQLLCHVYTKEELRDTNMRMLLLITRSKLFSIIQHAKRVFPFSQFPDRSLATRKEVDDLEHTINQLCAHIDCTAMDFEEYKWETRTKV